MSVPNWIARFLLALAVLLGLSEVVVRSLVQSPSAWRRDARYGLVREPGALVVQSKEGFGRHPVDAHGFLDQPLRPEPPHKALLLGDSFTAALQVMPGQRFSEQLEALVPGLEVLNAGRQGWYPPYYTLLAGDFEDAPLDLLIVQIGDGDLLDFDRPDNVAFERNPNGELELVTGAFRVDRGVRRHLLNQVFRYSGLAELTRVRAHILIQRERSRLEEKLRPAVAGTAPTGQQDKPDDVAERLLLMHRLLEPWHGRIVYLYTPSIDARVRPPRITWPEHARLLAGFGRAVGAPVVDPSAAMLDEFLRTGQPMHGFHNAAMGAGHLNAAGHRVIGIELAAAVRAMLP